MIDNYVFDKDYLLYLKNTLTSKKYNKIIDNSHKIIKSDIYIELLKEYKEYVNNISKLFCNLNVENPLEVALLYNELLFDGYFSCDKQFDLADTSKIDLLVQTWGSRVTTGHSVCRHNAFLLLDIERKLGNICESVDMICVRKKNIIKQKLVNNQKYTNPNHLVVGLQLNDNIYLYDPNNYYFLFKKDELHKDIVCFVGIEKSLKYYDETISFFNKSVNDNKFDYSKVDVYSNIDKNLINNISDKITYVCSQNEGVINEFYMDKSKKIRKIAYLNNEIILKQKLYK